MPSKKLIDILDEMNLKEDDINDMVIGKLNKLAKLIFSIDNTSPDLQFIDTILEDLIAKPYHRITKLEIKRCNNLYKQYKELK